MVSITNIATTTTYFVGAYYEVTGGVVTKYYYAGSQRIAMRNNSGLKFLVGDHLGSTSLTTDANGTLVSELRYKAWGEERYSSGTNPTKYTYTGQYSYTADFGLMFYNARWVDVSLGRFVQADSIVPNGGYSQSYDRYAYSWNNPIKYLDPTGHDPWWCSSATCESGYYQTQTNQATTSVPTSTPVPTSVATPASTPTLTILMPSGLTTVGQQAWNGLQNLGVLGNEQGAMEVVVGNEYGGVGSKLNNLPALDEAMTRRYYQFCSGGAWTAMCVNSFWGYIQAILEAADPSIAATKKDYANSFNSAGEVTGKAQAILTGSINPSWAIKDACGAGTKMCEWATVSKNRSPAFYNFLSGEVDGEPKFFILQNTHIYWLYPDQAFVVAPFVDVHALWVNYATDSAKENSDYSMFNFK